MVLKGKGESHTKKPSRKFSFYMGLAVIAVVALFFATLVGFAFATIIISSITGTIGGAKAVGFLIQTLIALLSVVGLFLSTVGAKVVLNWLEFG